MAPAKTRSRDRSSLPKYRVELPILLDDMELSVYAFRLYVHLKRVAERSEEGSCWESARTLASACNMSSGQVSKAKDELEQHGLIVRHIKMMRGGIGDDITIVDIWPENFARYAPERSAAPESDHHTITSEPKVITTRSLPESDHHTITSGESDQEAITLTSKRSYSDPIDHDQYHIESDSNTPPPTASEPNNGGGGGDSYATEVRALLGGYNILGAAKVATKYAALPDRPSLDAIRAAVVSMANSDPQTPNRIYRRLMDCPPPWPGLRAVPKNGAPVLAATRPNVPETTVAPAEVLRRMRER